MEKLINNNGMVCFFDILGYKSILDNNSIYDCAEIIKNIIVSLPNDVEDKFMDILRENKITGISQIIASKIKSYFINNFNKIIVSDSTVLFFYYEGLNEYDKDFFILLSLIYIITFQENSFWKGLPMRGCVDIGSFYYYENIFAGDTISRSYQEGDKLDFSGVIITDSCYNYVKMCKSPYNDILNKYIIKHSVSIKNRYQNSIQLEEKYLLKWFDESNYNKMDDFDDKVFDMFKKFNKNTENENIIQKIENTKDILKKFAFG